MANASGHSEKRRNRNLILPAFVGATKSEVGETFGTNYQLDYGMLCDLAMRERCAMLICHLILFVFANIHFVVPNSPHLIFLSSCIRIAD